MRWYYRQGKGEIHPQSPINPPEDAVAVESYRLQKDRERISPSEKRKRENDEVGSAIKKQVADRNISTQQPKSNQKDTALCDDCVGGGGVGSETKIICGLLEIYMGSL